MKLYVYVLKIDTGFAPNPFHDFCTLACCKPNIRRCSDIGDWVVGLSSAKRPDSNKLIYAMKIEEKLSFKEYWNGKRFQIKKCCTDSMLGKCGDNIYEPLSNGKWKQHPSWHTCLEFSDNECEKQKQIDLDGCCVLVSKKFVYFGRKAIPLPKRLAKFILPLGQNYKCNFDNKNVDEWDHFIEDFLKKQSGMLANPTIWDDSANENCIKAKNC
jgi:hypothetical protein